MKIKVLLLVGLFLNYSCYTKPEQKTKESNSNEIQLTNPIAGSWGMCKSISNGLEKSYNVCPTIIFSIDGTGNIKSTEKKIGDFQYSLKDNMIIFSFKNLDDKKAFFATGTEFNFKLQVQDNIETLELSQIKTNYKFILSRTK